MDISVRNRGLGASWSKAPSISSSRTSPFLTDASIMRTEKKDNIPVVSAEELAVGSYEQRLARLQKLHAETDYSGMEPRDRNKLIIDRFKAAFPDYTAILGGLYSKLGENSVYGRIRVEASKQAVKACEDFSFPKGKERVEYQRYIWGYDGMTEDEIRETILEKYKGGTLADKMAASQEFANVYIDSKATGFLTLQFDVEMRKGTEREYSYLDTENPIRIHAMIAYAKGTQISWQGLAQNLLAETQTHTFKSVDMSPEEAKRLRLAEMEDCLTDFLKKLERTERKYV